jgi:hypothetical protein
MLDTTTQENVVPLVAAPETPNVAPVDAPTDVPPPTEANTIDLNTITHEDVIQRLIDVNKRLTYELLISLKLHEHISVRDNPELAAQAEANAAGAKE